MAAETRVRIPDYDLEGALRMAELELAEERGELVTIEIRDPRSSSAPPGFIGPGMIDGMVGPLLEGMRAERERRALPARGRLSTLLRDLPVQWLDATWDALDLGSERPRDRKERERRIAESLVEGDTLLRVVAEKLSGEERGLLAYVLERGGRASAVVVTRRFGSDREDGWFWNEQPPTSVLGRVRLHGLVFVGAPAHGRRTRTVLVPRELRERLNEVLAATGETAEAGEAPDHVPAPALRPDLIEALDAAFSDGLTSSRRCRGTCGMVVTRGKHTARRGK